MAATHQHDSGYYLRLVHELALQVVAQLGGTRGSDYTDMKTFWDAHRECILTVMKARNLSREEIAGIGDHGDAQDINFGPARDGKSGSENVHERWAAMIIAAAALKELHSTAHAQTKLGQPALVLQPPVGGEIDPPVEPDRQPASVEVAEGLAEPALDMPAPAPAEVAPAATSKVTPGYVSVPIWNGRSVEPIDPRGPATKAVDAFRLADTPKKKVIAGSRLLLIALLFASPPLIAAIVVAIVQYFRHH